MIGDDVTNISDISPTVKVGIQPLPVDAERVASIRQAIAARHPGCKWDRRYPMKVLADNGIVAINGTTASFVEPLDADQMASLLSALDERAVRTSGLRVEDASWRADAAEWL